MTKKAGKGEKVTAMRGGSRFRLSEIRSIKCEACGREQFILSEDFPDGLTEAEARIIGWAEVDAGPKSTGWACPLHARGGKAKLTALAKEAGIAGVVSNGKF